jgi:uncharacterized protein (DUF1330 family)
MLPEQAQNLSAAVVFPGKPDCEIARSLSQHHLLRTSIDPHGRTFCNERKASPMRETPMTVYVLAQFKIHDRDQYEKYAAAFLPHFAQHKGTALVSDENVSVKEGTWDNTKAVLLSFPDEAAFEDWALSDEYQEIAKDRMAATDGSVVLLHSLQ